VLVSAFAFGGVPKKAVRKAFKEATIYVSPALLDEYRDIPLELEADEKINHIQLKALISGIASFVANTRIVYPTLKLSFCRDAEDNMLLECCYMAGADILVTGDKDLLEIKSLLFGLKILTPQKYLGE